MRSPIWFGELSTLRKKSAATTKGPKMPSVKSHRTSRHREWADIGSSIWLVRHLRLGIQMRWVRMLAWLLPGQECDLSPREYSFAKEEMTRWIKKGFYRPARLEEVKFVSPSFFHIGRRQAASLRGIRRCQSLFGGNKISDGPVLLSCLLLRRDD